MPSVYATWHGRCRDKIKREELCLRMAALGELAQSFFPASMTVKFFDQMIEGNILISKAHFMSDGNFAQLEENEKYLAVQKTTLYGVEFKLDPHSFYPSENKMSFVFCIDDNPNIDGIVVMVEDKTECLKYEDSLIKEADYFLETSNIHLRYFLEEWLGELMIWIKLHYIGDLRYWHHKQYWVDEDRLRSDAEWFGSYGKFELYDILKSNLEAALEYRTSGDQKKSGVSAAVGKLPEEIDDY